MALNQSWLLMFICINILYVKHGCCTLTCNFQPEKPIIGSTIEFNCKKIEPVLNETKLIVRRQQKTVAREVAREGELSTTYKWIATADDIIEFDVKCKEQNGDSVFDLCTKTIPVPISVSEPTPVLIDVKTTTNLPVPIPDEPQRKIPANEETQIPLPTLPVLVTNVVNRDMVTLGNELPNTNYYTTITYEVDYDDVLDEEEHSEGLELFDLYPNIFWSLVLGLVVIFFVVIIATMCLVFLTQSKRRKEKDLSNVPYTGSMEILTGPFRRPTGACLELSDGAAATRSTVDQACQTLSSDLPWMAIDIDDSIPHRYGPAGDLVIRPASVAGCIDVVEPNVLGPRGVNYIQANHGLARSESDRRYSAVCRTRTQNDPQFYIPEQRYRHSDHEMYHLQKYNPQVYDAQPIATEFVPERRYKRRANQQIAGVRQPRPYSYIDPSISQLVPPSVSRKPKAGNRDDLSDSTL